MSTYSVDALAPISNGRIPFLYVVTAKLRRACACWVSLQLASRSKPTIISFGCTLMFLAIIVNKGQANTTGRNCG